MNCSGTVAVALSATLWFATPALAETSGLSRTPDWQNENGAAIYVLENVAAQALDRARANKGARKSWCLMKNVELSQLIERLQNGQSVTVQEIEEGVDGLLGPQFGYASIAFDGCD